MSIATICHLTQTHTQTLNVKALSLPSQELEIAFEARSDESPFGGNRDINPYAVKPRLVPVRLAMRLDNSRFLL